MPSAHIVNETAVIQSPRVMQMASLFDVPLSEKSRVEWTVNLDPGEDWNVGLIVGPSGSGKTTIARALWGDRVITGFEWPEDRAVLDAFPAGMSIKDIVSLMSSVGFGSPPSWVRPYRCLSTGEQFRVTVARAIAEAKDIVVIDEFTSVVDRQVAQVASYAIQKAVRRRGAKLIAVSCHYDIIDWLQPDWIYQPGNDHLARGCLQRRPDIQLDICRVSREAWRMFSQHHYLTHKLHPGAQCFGGFIGNRCVAFASYIHFPHPRKRNIKLAHRLVVLPDFQGLGIGGRLNDWIGQYLYDRGFEYHNVVTHPAMIAYNSRSPHWKRIGTGLKGVSRGAVSMKRHTVRMAKRLSSSFVYVP